MLAKTFEIKVAVLGNVSVGKSTVLNALFRAKFSEVAMKRTTVGSNFFCIHSKELKSDQKISADSNGSFQENEYCKNDWLQLSDNLSSAETILQEITDDNRRLRESSSDIVHEKHFDIELDDEPIQMGKDTKLVFIDIPGINEAGTENKYKEYVSRNWHLFDCAVLVVDGKHDVRTDDQIYIINLVKENLKRREIPIIVLCNKIDYFTKEQEELVRIAQSEVEKIFGVSSVSAEAVQTFSSKKCLEASSIYDKSVVFISISAMQAYFYRLAPRMTLDQFEKIVDMTLLEEFGGELVGRVHWRKLSNSEKVKKVFEIVTDPENCKQGIDDCNFEIFLKALDHLLGGEERQREIIMDQIKTALNILENGLIEPGMSFHVKTAYEKLRLLDERQENLESTANLRKTFWKVFKKLEHSLFFEFEANWKDQKVALLVPLMDELAHYYSLCKEAEWINEKENVIKAKKNIVRRLIHVILAKEQEDLKLCKDGLWYEKSGAFSPFDWDIIKNSVLLLSYDKYFVEAFGYEKMILDRTFPTWQTVSSIDNYKICRICSGSMKCGNSGACINSTYVNYTCVCSACSCHKCPLADHVCLRSCNDCRKYFTSSVQNTICLKCNRELDSTGLCSTCQYSTDYYGFDLRMSYDCETNTLDPVDASTYCKYIHLKAPCTLSDPSHLGHLAWKYCQFMRTLDHGS